MTTRTDMKSEHSVEVLGVQGWETYPWLRHGFSRRCGGVTSVYGGDALNLGWTKEDTPDAVAENRRRFVAAVGHPVSDSTGFMLVGLRQTHSDIIRTIGRGDGAREGKLSTAEGKALLEGDGLITDVPGLLLGVGTADCVPVLVVDVGKRVVAAFHAGWRGTAARIVEQGVARMQGEYGSRAEDLIAAVGPSIGLCCYSVGGEVQAEFRSNFKYADELFRKIDEEPAIDPADQSIGPAREKSALSRLHLDLWEANRRQLLDAGIQEGHITVVSECTSCFRDVAGRRSYFSHRAEHGVAGRMLNVVGIVN